LWLPEANFFALMGPNDIPILNLLPDGATRNQKFIDKLNRRGEAIVLTPFMAIGCESQGDRGLAFLDALARASWETPPRIVKILKAFGRSCGYKMEPSDKLCHFENDKK
jgi:hypothetical protein